MPIPAFSADWADALRASVNLDEHFRNAAKGWTNLVALVVEPDEALTSGAAVEVNLEAGTCLSATATDPAALVAPFILSAGFPAWQDILGGTSDPIMAVASGKMRLTRGSLGTLMLHARAAKALLVCARNIDTLWPSPSPRS